VIEHLFDERPVDILVAREFEQFLARPQVVGAAAKVQVDPVEESAMDRGVVGEEPAVATLTK
jgi:hypothetical protein